MEDSSSEDSNPYTDEDDTNEQCILNGDIDSDTEVFEPNISALVISDDEPESSSEDQFDVVSVVSTKSKKRVSFRVDEDLVEILEIPGRMDSPLGEELEPCDPRQLTEDLANLNTNPVGRIFTNSLCSVSNVPSVEVSEPTISILPQRPKQVVRNVLPKREITSAKVDESNNDLVQIQGKRIQINKQILPVVDTHLTKGKLNHTKEKDITKSRTNHYAPRHNRTEKQRRERRSSHPLSEKHKLSSLKGYSRQRSESAGYERTKPSKISLSHSTGFGLSYRPPHHSHPGIRLRTRGGRIHSSPLRRQDQNNPIQTIPPLIQRSVSDLTPSSLRTSSANGDPFYIRVDTRTPSLLRRLHSWQMANAVLNGQELQTTCIAQMWEPQRQTESPLSLTSLH